LPLHLAGGIGRTCPAIQEGCQGAHPFHRPSRQDLTLIVLTLIVPDWKESLDCSSEDLSPSRKHTCTGRPLGSDAFLHDVESVTGRVVRPKQLGPGRGMSTMSPVTPLSLMPCVRSRSFLAAPQLMRGLRTQRQRGRH